MNSYEPDGETTLKPPIYVD